MNVKSLVGLMMTVLVLLKVAVDSIEMIEAELFILGSVRGSINKKDSNNPTFGEERCALVYEIERDDKISKGESLVQIRVINKELREANCSEGSSSFSMMGCSTSKCSNITKSRKSCDRNQTTKGKIDEYTVTITAKCMMRDEINILIPSGSDKEDYKSEINYER